MEMASKPMYAKKPVAAPATTPPTPKGRKPGGEQPGPPKLAGSARVSMTTMTKSSTSRLSAVANVFTDTEICTRTTAKHELEYSRSCDLSIIGQTKHEK